MVYYKFCSWNNFNNITQNIGINGILNPKKIFVTEKCVQNGTGILIIVVWN